VPGTGAGARLIGVPADQPRPDEAAIRRALAECMTAADIDDAMGWESGTARRRRWRAPDRGGLPNADAEIGGVALWFRRTIETWRSAPPERRPRRPAEVAEQPEPRPASSPPEPVSTTPEPEPAETSATTEPAAEETVEETADETVDETAQATPSIDDLAAVPSGYDLVVGQHVLADVHGRWRDAVVAHRDRTSVMVEYRLDDTPLGARRQRIGIDRVRLPTDNR
jgi:hypothetical protein